MAARDTAGLTQMIKRAGDRAWWWACVGMNEA